MSKGIAQLDLSDLALAAEVVRSSFSTVATGFRTVTCMESFGTNG